MNRQQRRLEKKKSKSILVSRPVAMAKCTICHLPTEMTEEELGKMQEVFGVRHVKCHENLKLWSSENNNENE